MIEEIDNGIHPARVYKLIEQLISIGKERKIDIIITIKKPFSYFITKNVNRITTCV